MYLNDGTIESYMLNGKNYEGKGIQYLKELVTTRNLFADLIVNGIRIIPCGPVTFSLSSGYVIASVDAHFALTEAANVTSLELSVHTAADPDDVLISSSTLVNTYIGNRDTDADFYFKVGSVFPFNELKFVLPGSFFNSLNTDEIPKKALEDYPAVVTSG